MWGRLLDALERSWRILTRPSVYFSLGFLTIGGFVAGVVFWGAFNTALELTNTETFCTSCHEMHDNVFQELKQTIHFTNRSGVRASCPDCHVPHEWTAQDRPQDAGVEGGLGQDLRHDQHAREVRGQAARAGRARMGAAQGQRLAWNAATATASNSMDFTRQSARAAQTHGTLLASGERTCIDCHKGIAHRLPDMAGVPGWDVPVTN